LPARPSVGTGQCSIAARRRRTARRRLQPVEDGIAGVLGPQRVRPLAQH
jgi:hypothetical protein